MSNNQEKLKEIGSCEAIIHKVTTTADGGARITIDVGLDASEIVQTLVKKKLNMDNSVLLAFVDV